MAEPVSVGLTIAGFLAKTFAGRKINEWLSDRDKRKAFAKALDEALTKVAEAGYPVKGPGALDEYLLTLKPVKDHFWAVLLDPSVDEEIDYARLGRELRGIYRENVPTADKALEAIEFFADVLMDKTLYQPALLDLINAKIIRQHDLRLSLAKKKALVRDYLRAEGEVISEHLLEDLGEGNRYVEPLIEKKEEKKREREEAAEETESLVPIDMNTYFTEGPDRKIVVVADSGYGKTTLLRELLLDASTSAKGKTFDVNAPIPVYFTPSEAAGCSEENIVGKVRARLMTCGYREGQVVQWVQDGFQNGRFVFLIDALDQVLNRQSLLGVLEGRAFRSNRVVVACRPNVWEMEKGHFRDYIELHIRGFDESRWEEYLGADRLNDLRDMVDEDFLSVPILLRLIVECWSQRDKETEPVRNRADLYTKVFNRLLKRQEDRDSAEKKTRKLAYVRTDLRLLAHDTLAIGHLGQFPRHEAVKILSEDSLDDLEARRWILETTETEEEIGFRHRSFQEYLAAEYLRSTIETEEDLDNLEPYLFHPNWEESLRFLVGLLPVKSAEYLVDRMLNLANGRPLFLYRDHLRLASLCLREIGEKAGQTQRKIIIERLAEDLGNLTLQDTAITVLSTLKDKKAVDLLGVLLTHQDLVVRGRAAYALGQIKSDRSVEPLIKALRDREAEVRRSAAYALGQIKSEKAVEPLIKALQHPEVNVRESAADALGEIKSEKAVESLIKALQDPEADVRGSAAYALGQIKSKRGVEPLIITLQHPEADIRWRAAYALAQIESEEAVEALIKALQYPKADVRSRGAYYLGEIKSEKAVEPLIKALQDPEADVRRSAALALVHIKSEKAVEALIKALQDPEADVRGSTVYGLGEIKSEKAVEPLIKVLQDPEADVRKSTADALGEIKSENAVEALIKALQDPEAQVRWRAANALAKIKSEKAVEPLIQALQDSEVQVRRRAANALGEIKSEKSVELLVKALQDPEADVRGNSAYALGEIRSEKSVEPLIKALQDPEAYVRRSAAHALDQIESEKAVEPLIKALQDPEAQVPRIAVDALGQIKSDKSVEPLIKALQHPDTYIRGSAAYALGGIKSEKAVEPLIKTLQDPAAEVRERATDALGEIRSEKSVEPLIKALQDPAAEVRERATDALGEIESEKAAEPLIKALQDPEADVRRSAADALGGLGSKQALAKLVDAWNQESSDIDRPLLLDAIRSCDRKVRSEQPITSAGNKQFK